jgi:putative colanic acid biosynthesis glycosyltransferase
MKILSLNTEALRGGAAKTALTLTHSINNSFPNFEVTLFHTGASSEDIDCINISKPGSRQLNAILQRLSGDKLIWDLGLATQLSKELDKYDVIHLHNLHGYYLDYQSLLIKLVSKPVVWTWHDMWPLTGRCGFPNDCEKWKNGCIKCPNIDIYPAAWFDWAARDYGKRYNIVRNLRKLRIVCPSEWLRNRAVERGYSPEKIAVIPNPVELAKFQANCKTSARNQLGIEKAGPILLFVAADCNDPRKGYDDFRKVVHLTGFNAIAIGKKPSTPDQKIDSIGAINDPELLNLYYSASDAYVITSTMDNYPNTVIEALASGTPVFGYAVGGIPEQVLPGRDWLANSGDSAQLCALIKSKLGSNNVIETPEDCHRHALQKWSPEVIARKYFSVYSEILETKAS